MLNQYYISAYNLFKKGFGKKASKLALYYFTFLEFSLLFLIFSFFTAFATQFHILTMSSSKAITVGILGLIFLLFKNWMGFTGKKRLVLNSKNKANLKPWQLILVPLVGIGLSVLFLQAV